MSVYAAPFSPGGEQGNFTLRGIVFQDARAGVDLGNCHLLHLGGDSILSSYRHHTGCTEGTPHCAQYTLEAALSNDAGRTWTPQGTIVSSTVGMWEPFLVAWPHAPTVELYDGPLLRTPHTSSSAATATATATAVPMLVRVLYSQELTNGGHQSIVWRESPDLGITWRAPHSDITLIRKKVKI